MTNKVLAKYFHIHLWFKNFTIFFHNLRNCLIATIFTVVQITLLRINGRILTLLTKRCRRLILFINLRGRLLTLLNNLRCRLLTLFINLRCRLLTLFINLRGRLLTLFINLRGVF